MTKKIQINPNEPLNELVTLNPGESFLVACMYDADSGEGYLLVTFNKATMRAKEVKVGNRTLRALPIIHVPVEKYKEDGNEWMVRTKDGREMLFSEWNALVRQKGIDPFDYTLDGMSIPQAEM